MKTVLVVILLIVLSVGAAYYGLPVLIDRETDGMRNDVRDLKLRVQKIEDLIKKEEEARKEASLPPTAGMREVVRTVNSLSVRVDNLDETLRKDIAAREEAVKKEGSATEEVLQQQEKAIRKVSNETESEIGKIKFDAAMANIRGHILKVRMDLANRNIGTAKTELDLIGDLFDQGKSSASEEHRKAIEELQGILKKAKAEIDTDMPAAINRVDLLWYEMGRLLRKT